MIDHAGTLAARPRWLVVLGAALGIAGLTMTVGGLVVWAGLGFARLPTRIEQIPLLTGALYVAVGWLLTVRVPANPVGWAFLAGGLALSLVLPLELLVADSYQALRPAPPHTVLFAWLVSSFATPAFITCLAIGGLLFPDGHFLSSRWRDAAVLTVLAAATVGLTVGLDPEGLVWYPTLPNPFRAPVEIEAVLIVLRAIGLAVLATSFLAVFVAQAIRYRHGDVVTRAQLRWVLAAVVVQVIVGIPFVVARYMVDVGQGARETTIVLAQAALWLLPLAATFAITRYHLFGIDTLIGRSQVYVPLMGALGGLYALAVLVFQRVFVAITGETSDLALLLAVFLIAGVFTPLRKGLESAVERWTRPAAAPKLVALDDSPDAEARPPEVVAVQQSAELKEMAARLIALQRLEERMASAGSLAPGGTATRLPIDASGRVPCPRGPASYLACLGCPQLSAITTVPPEIHCSMRARGS